MSPHSYYFTLSQAIAELERRRHDRDLVKKVEDYLQEDIPDHFKNGPLFYFARHVATPNYETLAFIDLSKQLNFKPVIGQDTHDKFVTQNTLKKRLGKLPIIMGESRDGTEIIEHLNVLDFNTAQGKMLYELKTHSGENLVDFHNHLFDVALQDPPTIVDDALWINRHSRGNLLEHYKRHFALFVVHGILFEYFYIDDDKYEAQMFQDVAIPAYEHTLKVFGVPPLMTPPISPSVSYRLWEGFPKKIYEAVKRHTKEV